MTDAEYCQWREDEADPETQCPVRIDGGGRFCGPHRRRHGEKLLVDLTRIQAQFPPSGRPS